MGIEKDMVVSERDSILATSIPSYPAYTHAETRRPMINQKNTPKIHTQGENRTGEVAGEHIGTQREI